MQVRSNPDLSRKNRSTNRIVWKLTNGERVNRSRRYDEFPAKTMGEKFILTFSYHCHNIYSYAEFWAQRIICKLIET